MMKNKGSGHHFMPEKVYCYGDTKPGIKKIYLPEIGPKKRQEKEQKKQKHMNNKKAGNGCLKGLKKI